MSFPTLCCSTSDSHYSPNGDHLDLSLTRKPAARVFVGTLLVLHEIASAAPQNVRNTPRHCHRRIRTFWVAPIHCEGQTVRRLQLSPTFRNEESCEVHSLEMILAIPTSQTPPQPRGIIDVEVQDALVQFRTNPAIKLVNIGRHP